MSDLTPKLPVNGNRNRIAAGMAWLLFWGLMVLVALEDHRRDGGTAYWQPVLWETSSALVCTGLLLFHRRLMARHDALIASPWRWFALQARMLPVYWVAFVPLVFGLRHAVYALAGASYEHETWPQVFVYESLKLTVFIGLFTVIGFGLLSYRELLGARVRAEQAHALLREAQLQSLARQMQPHFLFNALNTISSLMHTDVARVDATLLQLADMLRAALALGERPQATLEEELRLARAYAGVMAERFDGRATVHWQVDDAVLGVALPAMSVQPLLENVFKHTVERRRAPTRITVGAVREGAQLVLRVEDDAGILGQDNGEGRGIGLANLRARLAALHGSSASVELSQLAPAGVRTELRLPCAS
ncbi:sensor histidine kinase [Massilia yuzhufengensis]|uniref:Histidine kinase n=1 Tax=Massilia yuzhufengensis TaxID=1164594 RepID=A0A1I1GYP7_9BURK|nr:histidine kinase [Massilia yuzhufengensis]SFC14998.1 Histidine kinase [Massilia yuzhufengensis]